MSTMKIHIDAMSDTFRRHRRNLMATSLLLCFMKYSGLVIRRITPMGTEIILDDEKAVFVMLWLLWFYFVYGNDRVKVTHCDHGIMTHPLTSLFSFKCLSPR